jgi:hypothetical protein
MQLFLIIWFSLTAISVAYVAYDLFTSTPEMKVMKWGWIMVTLYTGIAGLIIYIFSCKAKPDQHEKFIAPLWKQTVGSTIHCMAGDATGVIVVAFITALLNLPMGIDSILEYIAGFAFGLFIFQALFMKDMLGGSYWQAVRKTWYPEWLSMNFVMAGMIPVMIILMTSDMQNMEVTSLRFWGIMSLASLVGGILAIPINWWMVKNKLKHGMGTEKAIGEGGAVTAAMPNKPKMNMEHMNMKGMEMPSMNMKDMQEQPKAFADNKTSDTGMAGMNMEPTVSPRSKIFFAIFSIIVLAIGIALAAYWGDFSMRPKGNMNMNMNMEIIK